MTQQDFDLIVIGAGSGGLSAAIRAASHGARVALIDPGELGGTCVNVGCVPKKAMWLAAELAGAQRIAAQIGFDAPVGRLDWPAFVQRRQGYIANIHTSYQRRLDELGVRRVVATATLLGDRVVAVDDQRFQAPHILIATGAAPQRPDLPGAELGVDSNGFFDLRAAPARVALIGGGYIAVELAGVLHALGSQVSIVLRGARLMQPFDRECANHLAALYAADGIRLFGNVDVSALQRDGDGMRIVAESAPDDVFDCVIWATGRSPSTHGLGLDLAGVDLDSKGHIVVDDRQNTSAAGIYAIGDVSTDLPLTPVAVKAGRCLAERLFNHASDAQLDRRLIPTVVFAHPPMASVGLSEEAAQAEFGSDLRIYRHRFRPMLAALAGHQPQTLMKLVCTGPDERVVGLHMVGSAADEIVQGFALALKLGATKADFDAVVAVHPTSAEEMVLMR